VQVERLLLVLTLGAPSGLHSFTCNTVGSWHIQSLLASGQLALLTDVIFITAIICMSW
jgi:hypothetical protein